MKKTLLIPLTLISILTSSASSCHKNNNTSLTNTTTPMTSNKIKITIHEKTFTATLADNNSSKALYNLLPLTMNMIELNNNEKYYELPNNLPTNSSKPNTIKTGDIMLYGSKTLVLFYKTFSTPYSYTKLGSIDDANDLENTLGAGNVKVTFTIE